MSDNLRLVFGLTAGLFIFVPILIIGASLALKDLWRFVDGSLGLIQGRESKRERGFLQPLSALMVFLTVPLYSKGYSFFPLSMPVIHLFFFYWPIPQLYRRYRKPQMLEAEEPEEVLLPGKTALPVRKGVMRKGVRLVRLKD